MSAIIAQRNALLPALALVNKAIERRSTIPILQNILLSYEPGTLTLVGTDLDCELRASLACTAQGAGSFTLPAGTLHDAVRKMPDGAEIRIEAEDGTFATIAAGRSRFRMQILPAADFPGMSGIEGANRFALPAQALGRMLATIAFAISTEETRYYLNGIHWHVDDAHLNAVATDGHRLAKFPVPLPDGAAGMPAIIIPRRTVGLLKSLLGDKGDVMVEVSAGKIRFVTDEGTLLSKLIDGTFPDYRRVIPQANANRFTVRRGDLSSSVDRVITIASERSSGVKFSFGRETATLASNSPDRGSAADEVTLVSVEGDDVEIGFNGRYCLDMLNATTAESIVFVLGGAGDPALIQPAEDGVQPLFVLMPMRM
jgi:DNA polymerase-3 subunit beta